MPPKKIEGEERALDVPKSDLDPRDAQMAKMQEQLDILTGALASRESVPKAERVYKRTARLMFTNDEKLVVGFGQARADRTDKTGRTINVELTVQDADGVESKETVEYLGMMQSFPRYLVNIKEIKREETVVHQGPIPVSHRTVNPDPVGIHEGGKGFTSRSVVLEHTTVSAMATVEFLEGPWIGKEVTVDAKCMNP
jgi:hypothetical protein